jgi:phosphate transport system substrate-binding protein
MMNTSFGKAALGVLFVFAGASSVGAQATLHGAGATFPEPLYKRWVSEYQKVNPAAAIDYQGIGSGGGIKGITDKTIDFAGSDAPLSKGEITKAGGAENLIEIPSCAGAVVPAYNLPEVSGPLNFSGDVLAQIYLGKITKWNDPAIAKLNPDAKLPDTAITAVYRTDGSGTNFVFTNYLATQSDDFKGTVGMGKQVKWPVGQGGKGNPGVTAIVQQTPGAIGYVEQNFADKNSIPYGAVQNKAGKFIKASPDSVSAAGGGAVGEFKGSLLAANIWNQDGDDAYPIASFTYLIVYKDLNNLKSKDQAQALVSFMWWATHDGQKYAKELDYAPIAAPVQQKVEEVLNGLTFGGAEVKPVTDAK